MPNNVTLSVLGQSVIGLIIPWVIAYGTGSLIQTVPGLWWFTISIAAAIGYGLTFGIGIAINDEVCPTTKLGEIAYWSVVQPALSTLTLGAVMMFGFLRDPIEVLVRSRGFTSPQFVFAAVASYYLFWAFAIGGTIAGYQAKVC